MPTFGEKSTFNLETPEENHLKLLNGRFVRWQEKQNNLFTFSINLLLTISISAIGLIINNFDNSLLKNKHFFKYSLPQTVILIITVSAFFGIAALFCRLFDFRNTKTIIRKRILLFKVKNNIKYENCIELTKIELTSKIEKLNCWTTFLGNATWVLFILQTVVFLTSILIIVCVI